MRRLRSVIFLFLLVLLFLEIWIGFPIPIEVAPPNRKVLVEEGAESNAEQKAKGVHLVESREGERDWELFAEVAESVQGMAGWKLEKVKVNFYRSKQIEFVVMGETGFFDTKSRDIRIEGKVRTSTSNGYIIDTDLVQYEADSRVLESPGRVRMQAPRNKTRLAATFQGDGLMARLETKDIELKKNVVATQPMKSQVPLEIKSEKAFFRTVDSAVRFEGQVRLHYGEKKIEGPKALFLYGDSADVLESVRMEGGVRMSDVNSFATSDSVRFDPEANSYILSGAPRVVQDSDEIQGDEITLLDGGRKIKVNRIKARVEKE